MASVLFLDRDGVLNEKAPTGAYVTDAAAFTLLPGVPEALADLRRAVPGLRIAVVTNQRGIARGKVSAATVDALHAQLRGELRAAGGDVDAIEVCPHEIDACDCRKPALGMFQRVLARCPGVDPAACALVGDSLSDMEAGHRLGARTYLVGERARREVVRRASVERGVRVDEVADSLPLLVGDGGSSRGCATASRRRRRRRVPADAGMLMRAFGARGRGGRTRRVMVVGSGTRFLSGISVYTVRLASTLADAGSRVSIMTMRQLLPTRLYPGRDRVGQALTELGGPSSLPTFDGIDWYWLPSMLKAARFMGNQRPHVLILQWWSGTVLHSYLALCLLARLVGARVVIEFHEVLDTGEARIPLAAAYARIVGGAVLRLASGCTVHSTFDQELLRSHWGLGGKPIAVLPHGPHDHYQRDPGAAELPPLRDAPPGCCNLLFFGVIRPYKGLEDLVVAFDRLSDAEVRGYWLTVVGETWEGYTLPAERIAASRHRDRITFVNRYVHDAELDAYLRGADAVALPYRRSSLSGPLHVAMGYGLPIVMTDVGGNAEAAEGYEGIELVPVDDPAALLASIRRLPALAGQRFRHPRSWAATATAYERFLDALEEGATPTATEADGVAGEGDGAAADQAP